METFPQHQQLQKNVLLTICSDRILQEVNFDKYRCARLVLDCLCSWGDPSMNRMSVAICSILAAKISREEPEWSVNLKKALAVLFQAKFDVASWLSEEKQQEVSYFFPSN